MSAKLTGEELLRVQIIKNLLEIEPKTTKAPIDVELWVQYNVSKKEYDTYTYRIINNYVLDKDAKSKIFTISGTVKDLRNRTESDHESRMVAYLSERGLILDRTRPTKDELLVVNYNRSLFCSGEKKSIKSLFNITISYLFYNDREITKDRLENLFTHGTTEIRILDENRKGSITQLVKSTTSMIEFPTETIIMEPITEKTKRSGGNQFITQSETTKAWNAIGKDIEKYPQLANQINMKHDEVEQIKKMSFLNDTLMAFTTEYQNSFGNNMVKDQKHEDFEKTFKTMLNQFQSLAIIKQEEETKINKGNSQTLNDNSKRIKTEVLDK